MHAAIADKREELAELCRRHGVARLDVFGSAARGTDFDPRTSDADFLVEFVSGDGQARFDQYFDFVEGLRRILRRRVDLIESGAIHNPYLREAIDSSRERIYAK